MTVLGHQRGEDAFAQAAVGNAQALTGPDPQQRLEDGAARQHQIGALLPDAGLRHPLGIRHAHQIAGHVAHVARRQPATIDARALVDRKLEVDAGDGGDRAGGAEEMRAFARDPLAEAVLRLERRHGGHHVGDHGLVVFRRDVAPAMPLGEIDHADR